MLFSKENPNIKQSLAKRPSIKQLEREQTMTLMEIDKRILEIVYLLEDVNEKNHDELVLEHERLQKRKEELEKK